MKNFVNVWLPLLLSLLSLLLLNLGLYFRLLPPDDSRPLSYQRLKQEYLAGQWSGFPCRLQNGLAVRDVTGDRYFRVEFSDASPSTGEAS